MNAFVGTREVASGEELRELLAELALRNPVGKKPGFCYFLRSPHETSGFLAELPQDFATAAEGQMFNVDLELRWKRRGEGFSLLVLSRKELDIDGFESLGEKWKTSDRPVELYQKEEARFPRRFRYGEFKGKVGQRYFRDAETSTVRFVALTIGSP